MRVEAIMPLVQRLSEKYTFNESSSITYETLEMLMRSVAYTIQIGSRGNHTQNVNLSDKGAIEGIKGVSLEVIYEEGVHIIQEMTKTSMSMYQQIMSSFEDYGVYNYRETLVTGMEAFFKTYDWTYKPYDHVLTLDYPLLYKGDLGEGILCIKTYIEEIFYEQCCLQLFDKAHIIHFLECIQGDYEQDFMENIWERVLMSVLCLQLLNYELEAIIDRPLILQQEEGIQLIRYYGDISYEALDEKVRSFIDKWEERLGLSPGHWDSRNYTYSILQGIQQGNIVHQVNGLNIQK